MAALMIWRLSKTHLYFRISCQPNECGFHRRKIINKAAQSLPASCFAQRFAGLDNLFRLGQRTGSKSQFAVSCLHDDERAPSISILNLVRTNIRFRRLWASRQRTSSSAAAPLRQSTIRLSSMAGDWWTQLADHVWTKACPKGQCT